MKPIKKPSKTISGITPVAIMLPPRPCDHGSCIYCPNLDVPQSYTPKSPVVLRASALKYDSYKQVKSRIETYKALKHPTEKIEIIIMGGTFLEYPDDFQEKFIKGIYDALNMPQHSAKGTSSGAKSKTLEQAQKLNETAKHRCVALCIETRPNKAVPFINKMRKWGATRIELGVQAADDKIYKITKRGHKIKDIIQATKALKQAGFKIGYHLMPGLPGSNPKKDIKLFKRMFNNSNFKPDQIKIYPCQVMPGSELEQMYWNGKYKPYDKETIKNILIKMMKLTPRYTRIMRIMREIHPDYITAGTKRIDLRGEIEQEFKKSNTKLNEIKSREIGIAIRNKENINQDLKIKITKYKASEGTEYFLEYINKDNILFGLLRLRIENKMTSEASTPRGGGWGSGGKQKTAMIREVHVYGQALDLGEKTEGAQHKGLGKQLIAKAEQIAKNNKCKKLSIISGIGVREYYRKLGYKLEESYMVKEF